MAVSAGTVYLDVRPDMSGFTGALGSSVGGLKTQLAGIGKSIAAGFAVTEIVQFGVQSVQAAEEAEAAVRGLQATLNSMGRDIPVEALTSMATEVSKLTGFEDEAIISGQGLLATFVNISDEMVKSLTPAMVDFAARFTSGNIETAAKMMGKALNDPIKGVTALTRAGVQFSETEKEKIAVLVQSGQIEKAQAMILAELKRETQGFAQANATATQKMKVAWGEFQEFVGGAILPLFSKLATNITDMFTSINEGDAAGGFKAFGNQLLTLGSTLPIVGKGFQMLDNALSQPERLAAFKQGFQQVTASIKNGSITRTGAIAEINRLSQVTGIEMPRSASFLVDAIMRENGVVANSTGKIQSNSQARKANAQAARDQLSAILATTDAQFAVIDANQQVAAAQKVVNRLEQQGITSGSRLEAAQRELITAANAREGAVLAYAQAQIEAGRTENQARADTIALGRAYGMTKQDVMSVLGPLSQYESKLRAIPSNVQTTVTTSFVQRGQPPGSGSGGFHVGASGGIVTRPTVALIGEAGPEAVVPLNRAPGASPLPGGGGGWHELRITNWETGRAMIREVSDDSVHNDANFQNTVSRMSK